MRLNDRQIATILHGLRMIQSNGRIEGCAAGMCEHFESCEPMTDTEIDELCESINFLTASSEVSFCCE